MHTPQLPEFNGNSANTSREEYDAYLREVRDTVARAVPGTIVGVGNHTFGHDEGGQAAVSVQGEFVEKVRQLFPSLEVRALSAAEYEGHVARQQQQGESHLKIHRAA